MRRNGQKFLLLFVVPICVIGLLVAMTNSAAVVPAASRPSTAQAAPAVAPAFAAMAYYDQNCAHCHGPQGSFYGPTLGQKLTDPQLVKVIDDMASGPGNAPLKPDQLAAETAFHRALILHTPYLSVTQAEDDGNWSGEATPDATLTIRVRGVQVNVTHDDATWTAKLPVGTKRADVTITAELNSVTTSLRLADAAYSSTAPLPPPSARQR